MRSAMLLVLLLAAAGVPAADLQVIDDFEYGVRGWYLVEGTKPADAPPLCAMVATADAKVGRAAAHLRYQPCPETWTHRQLNIATTDWLANDCDRVRFWLKGDGSGETLNLMFGNYEVRPSLCFRYPIRLDFSDWREITVPFADFEPKDQMAGVLGRLVLAQLNVSRTTKPVDVLLDDLVVLPAAKLGPAEHFFTLAVTPTGGWSDEAPSAPIPVSNLMGLPGGVILGTFLHGIRNHADLHAPVSFAVEYPEAGSFGVKVGDTSGYGGLRLLLHVDGVEVLRRDFPGETKTTLTQFRGYYGVPVAAGRQRVRLRVSSHFRRVALG